MNTLKTPSPVKALGASPDSGNGKSLSFKTVAKKLELILLTLKQLNTRDRLVHKLEELKKQLPETKPAYSKYLEELRQLYYEVTREVEEPKLKYLSAFRIFRKYIAPKMKAEYPNHTGKERQCIIRQHWRELEKPIKSLFVDQSRQDEERAKNEAKAKLKLRQPTAMKLDMSSTNGRKPMADITDLLKK